MSALEPATSSRWDPAMLARYDLRGPRYTAYPGAHCFEDGFDEQVYQRALRQVAWNDKAISLYVHLPFCFDICHYCACNKIVTRDREKIAEYLRYLKLEINRLAAELHESSPKKKRIAALHLGGGTPNYLDASQMTELVYELSNAFELDDSDEREFSIEVDPRLADPDMINLLAGLGFNRISFGVQDFHPDVQQAVNRIQSFELCETLVNTARDLGIRSVNIDLMYGLPEQTTERFQSTIERVIELAPDRIALYNYAHMPDRFSSQRSIDRQKLPTAEEKLALFCQSAELLEASGYRFLGMDHFAKIGSDIDVAEREGKMIRNFQGYSIQHTEHNLAVGVSAISSLEDCYVQNERDLEAYYQALDSNRSVLSKGVCLTRDDYIRRFVIMSLLCQLRLDKGVFEESFDVPFDQYFSAQLAGLKEFGEDGLLVMGADRIEVTAQGRLFLRNICMLFDASLPGHGSGAIPVKLEGMTAQAANEYSVDEGRPRFSKTI